MAEEITLLIREAALGNEASRERLMSLIYQDLTRIARSRLARERTYTDLNACSLVHEAYLRFSDNLPSDAPSRRVFFAYACRAMESVIIDHVRHRGAKKRGEGIAEVTLGTGVDAAVYQDDQVEALYAAMEQLKRVDEAMHEIVHLRYFGGLTVEQVAEMLDSSPATIKRRWKEAMVILKDAIPD